MKKALPALWLAVLLALLLRYATPAPPWPYAFHSLALAGWVWCALRERAALRDVLREHRLLLGAAALFVLMLHAAALALSYTHPARIAIAQPAQAGLLLCLAPLVVFLRDRTLARLMVGALALLCAWHLVALPLEGIAGVQLSWHPVLLRPREIGVLGYQAAGLAWQAYYFPGLLMGAFYIAAGAIGEEDVFGPRRMDARAWLALSLLWAMAVACVQSRSALAGALAASLLGLLGYSQWRSRRMWIALAIVGAAGVALFWLLFSQNKSGPGLRWAYLLLYVARSFDAGWLWTGRGYTLEPDPAMQVPGMQFVDHSHNDFAQVFFTWGLPAVIAYALCWGALLRLVLVRARSGIWWPLIALVAVGPSFLTDLGFHHLEKVGFLVMLAGVAMAGGGKSWGSLRSPPAYVSREETR